MAPSQCTVCVDKTWQPFNLSLLCVQRVTAHLHWGKQTSKHDAFILITFYFSQRRSKKMTGQAQSSGYQPETYEAQGISTADKAKLYDWTLTCLFKVRILIYRSCKVLVPYFKILFSKTCYFSYKSNACHKFFFLNWSV